MKAFFLYAAKVDIHAGSESDKSDAGPVIEGGNSLLLLGCWLT